MQSSALSIYLFRFATLASWVLALVLVALVVNTLFERALTRPVQWSVIESNIDPRVAARHISARLPADQVVAPRSPPPPPEPVRATLDLTLVGIATGFAGAPGFALFMSGGGESVFATRNQSLPNGATLRVIAQDHVVIDLHGTEQALHLSPPRSSASSPQR